MRGFWCLIIVLVHTPTPYQNTIQDMIGSFAYVGVTYFFLTSAYGLSLTNSKKKYNIMLWKNRFIKLLIPCFIVNIISVFSTALLLHNPINIPNIFKINQWVIWLIIAYIFWIMSHQCNLSKYSNHLTCLLIIVFSLTIYILQKSNHYHYNSWAPEIYGFIWGILLFVLFNKFKSYFKTNWFTKNIILGLVSLILGVTYLKTKYIFFFGGYFIKIILGLSILLFMLALNTKLSIENKITLFLGKISYEIYLIHGFIFTLVSRIFKSIESGFYLLLSIIITVLLSIIVNYISKKIINILCSSNK